MMYNESEYNTSQYNAEGSELSFSDGITVADATISKQVFLTFMEFLFTDETITADFTVKSLSDVIRLADWLQIERKQDNSGWFN